jgi:hypothetical protein
MDWKHVVFKLLTPGKTPHELVPKLFGPLRERYADRPGGYTRVLLIEPLKSDQAPSAILELVDGPKDMRFAMTARTIATTRKVGRPLSEMTERNIEKVTRYRKNGERELQDMVKMMNGVAIGGRDDAVTIPRPRDPRPSKGGGEATEREQ